MKNLLKNKKILVSGVGKGLGYEIMKDCIKNGAFVYGFTRSMNDIKKIKSKFKKNIKIFHGDATDNNFLKELFLYFKKRNIALNGLVNNAGIRQRISFVDIKKNDIENIMNVNFISPFLLCKYFVKQSNKHLDSSIVNIGSIVGEKPFVDLIGYASSKSALAGFSKSLALELAEKKKNIRVNCVNPGFVKTSYYKKFKKNSKLHSWTLSKTSAGRWGKPFEISKLVIFLLSNDSSYINGEIINIDGGWV
tara:strand:- start:2531 stop:3277 length:747 start_codon:yes stop_codon:yes gene_type:complete